MQHAHTFSMVVTAFLILACQFGLADFRILYGNSYVIAIAKS